MVGVRGTLAERLWRRVEKGDGCWLWTGALHRNGYGKIGLGRAGEGTALTHRIAWELVHGAHPCLRGPLPSDVYVCHHCDINYAPGDTTYRRCVRPDHLFLSSNSGNLLDASAKGRTGSQLHPESRPRGDRSPSRARPERLARGERVGTAKLTADQVRAIRGRRAEGESLAALAREFGISWTSANKIVRRRSWSHVA